MLEGTQNRNPVHSNLNPKREIAGEGDLETKNIYMACFDLAITILLKATDCVNKLTGLLINSFVAHIRQHMHSRVYHGGFCCFLSVHAMLTLCQ